MNPDEVLPLLALRECLAVADHDMPTVLEHFLARHHCDASMSRRIASLVGQFALHQSPDDRATYARVVGQILADAARPNRSVNVQS